MFIVANDIPAGTTVSADVCVIGGGAAGIAISRELTQAGRTVALLESGRLQFDDASNDLNAGASIGRAYSDLTACRLRYFGGTTNHWGGWCLPLDPIDFERGWPISRADLDPCYARAQPVCQVGPFDYAVENWGIRRADIPAPFAGPHFVPKMLQNSPPTRFAEAYGPELGRSDKVSVYLGATVSTLLTTDADRSVTQAQVTCLGGAQFNVQARAYVLACGGIENARLLLASGASGCGLGNGHDLVGRHFMVHLECPGGTIAVADPYTDFDFYTNVTSNGRDYEPYGHRFVSFIGLSEATMRAQNLPNLKLMWNFDYTPAFRTVQRCAAC